MGRSRSKRKRKNKEKSGERRKDIMDIDIDNESPWWGESMAWNVECRPIIYFAWAQMSRHTKHPTPNTKHWTFWTLNTEHWTHTLKRSTEKEKKKKMGKEGKKKKCFVLYVPMYRMESPWSCLLSFPLWSWELGLVDAFSAFFSLFSLFSRSRKDKRKRQKRKKERRKEREGIGISIGYRTFLLPNSKNHWVIEEKRPRNK